jgi:hypothetical protein
MVVDCLIAIRLITLWAALRAVGPDEFDRMMAGGLKVKYLEKADGRRTLWKKNVANDPSELNEGDWVYFYNHPDYPEKRGGVWRGENAVVTKTNGENKYQGFGAEVDGRDELQDARNDGLEPSHPDYAHGDPPGLVKPHRPNEPAYKNQDLGKIHRFEPVPPSEWPPSPPSNGYW